MTDEKRAALKSALEPMSGMMPAAESSELAQAKNDLEVMKVTVAITKLKQEIAVLNSGALLKDLERNERLSQGLEMVVTEVLPSLASLLKAWAKHMEPQEAATTPATPIR